METRELINPEDNPQGMPQSNSEWKNFRLSQPIILLDEKKGIELRRRDIIEGKTARGTTSLIVLLRITEWWTYYLINKKNTAGQIEPKCQKCPTIQFMNALEAGDVWLVDHEKVDYERFSQAFITSEAFLNQCSLEKAIEVSEQQMIEHVSQGGMQHG